MPGIIPMKVIKVANGSQSRIAQACDRCRSKKIRCDGVRPCCSQCASVRFECKTSDKLSRRAFPRGYTESLEERVRNLEAEVHELKTLLDEKDEKIDVLSRIHSFASSSQRRPAKQSQLPLNLPREGEAKVEPAADDAVISVRQSQAISSSELASTPISSTAGFLSRAPPPQNLWVFFCYVFKVL